MSRTMMYNILNENTRNHIMAKKRRIFSNEFKARIALEAQIGLKSVNEIATENGIFANQVGQWKNELNNRASELFSKKFQPEVSDEQEEKITSPLYTEIGKLKMENEWLKKKLRPFQ